MHEVLFSSKDKTWETPSLLFETLNTEFNFTLDPCCVKETAKCSKYYTPQENGLIQDWSGETIFVNPPYGREIIQWVTKANEEAKKGTTIVMLLPARTDTRWFHDWVYGHADLRFIRGRLAFLLNGKAHGKAPFPSIIVIFNQGSNQK